MISKQNPIPWKVTEIWRAFLWWITQNGPNATFLQILSIKNVQEPLIKLIPTGCNHPRGKKSRRKTRTILWLWDPSRPTLAYGGESIGYWKVNTQNDHAPHAHATRHDATTDVAAVAAATTATSMLGRWVPTTIVAADIIVNGDSISISTADRRLRLLAAFEQSGSRTKTVVIMNSSNFKLSETIFKHENVTLFSIWEWLMDFVKNDLESGGQPRENWWKLDSNCLKFIFCFA